MCESDEAVRSAERRLQLEGRPERDIHRAEPSRRSGRGRTPPGQAPPPGRRPPGSGHHRRWRPSNTIPATGTYVGPDGHVYTQSNLARGASKGANMAADADAPDSGSERDRPRTTPAQASSRCRTAPNRRATSRTTTADGRRRFRRRGAGEAVDVAVRLATVVGLVAVVGLTALVGWLGFRDYQSHRAHEQTRTVHSGRRDRAR